MTITKDLLIKLKDDLILLVQQQLIQKGVESNSSLVQSIDFIPTDKGLAMLANDYYEYASTGRRPKARKVPINDLIAWVKKYKIGSGNVNNTAWAIQQSIYKNGIKGKNYITPVEDGVADLTSEQLAEVLSEVIADEMASAFNTKI